MEFNNPSTRATTHQSRSPRRRFTWFSFQNATVLVILLAIMASGAALRFIGQNWDDYTFLHPDERFLTLSVLPMVGGVNNFTAAPDEYPTQVVYARNDETRFTTVIEMSFATDLVIGVVEDSVGSEFAPGQWADTQILTFPTPENLVAALSSAQIDAAVVDDKSQGLFTGIALQVGYVDSVGVQQSLCLYRFPDTEGIGTYFDTQCSPYNPHNANTHFYTYGTLPLFMAHVASNTLQGIQGDAFEGGHLAWRALSAIFDVLTIGLVFILGTRMHNRWAGLLAALLYAFAALPIQKAHFGTVNSITHFFVVLGLLSAVNVQDSGRWLWYILFGFAAGSAVAGRINTAPLAGMIFIAGAIQLLPAFDTTISNRERTGTIVRVVIGVMLAGIVALITFRVFNPYAFASTSIIPTGLNPRWLANIAEGQFGVSGMQDTPPNWQWMGQASYFYPLKDMLLWGMGIAFGITAWLGFVWSGIRLFRGRIGATRNIIIFIWVLGYFAWMGRLWVMTMRYYLPLYGALAVLAAWCLMQLWDMARKRQHSQVLLRSLLLLFATILGGVAISQLESNTPMSVITGIVALVLAGSAILPRLGTRRATVLVGFVAVFTVVWGLMFVNIYRHQLTRVQASRWIFENIPGDFALPFESDDTDLGLINIAIWNNGFPTEEPNLLLERVTTFDNNIPLSDTFIAPADGIISVIESPHLGDPLDDPEPESLEISIFHVKSGEKLTSLIITQDFPRGDDDELGAAYQFELDEPIQLLAGEQYQFQAEVIDGAPLISSGAVVMTEGDWDDRLTSTQACQLPNGLTLADDVPPGLVPASECNGKQSWQALINSQDLAMSYPVDDRIKRDNLLPGLERAEYITISSNRFYDTVTRNRTRWPLSTAYYEALFSGELGFELVAVFQESYELGVLSVSDQYLPTFDSPNWLNMLEADEAFHVYDHPVAFIFQKTDAYSYENMYHLLGEIPLEQSNMVGISNSSLDSIGVIYNSSIDADQNPTALQLTPEDREIQQAGGTWSERFDVASIVNNNQVVGSVVWWLVIMLFGWVSFPLTFAIFPKLADRGYGFAKFVGLLLVAWSAWFISSLRVPLWSQIGVVLLLLALAFVSSVIVYRRRHEFGGYIRNHWRRLFAIEVITLVLFIAFIFVRLTNPDLWHVGKGGEKPMDFAYFNAVLRSTIFPAYDPWHGGGFINYYYFGFVLVGSPVLLLKMVPAFAYNLIVPTLFALTGIGAFSAAFNIVSAWRDRPAAQAHARKNRRRYGNPWVAGIMALLFAAVFGNLDTIRVVGNGLAQLGGYQQSTGIAQYYVEQYTAENGIPPNVDVELELRSRAENPPIGDRISYEIGNTISLWTGVINGLGRAVGGDVLPIGTDRWYWGPSRVLAETPGVEGNAITEMPYFTFVYGDLHAHMIDMPMLLFIMAFLLNEFLSARREERGFRSRFIALAIGAMAVGLIRATNTWDWPSFLLFATVSLLYFWWVRWRAFHRHALVELIWYVLGFVAMSIFFVAPYTAWYAATYNSVAMWQGGKTPLWAYWDIHGLFLFLMLSLLLWDTVRWFRRVRISDLRGRSNLLAATAIGLALVGLVSGILAIIGYQVALLALPMIVWIAILFFRPNQNTVMQFVLVLAGFALAMTLGVEFIVIGGDIGRQNTVFKFYMQAWLLFSVASGAAFAWLIQTLDDWSPRLRVLWMLPLVIMIIIAGIFPFTATRGRSFDRMVPDLPPTLNGMDYMAYTQHYESNVLTGEAEVIDFSGDYQMIRWLQDNVQGSPVIMEGRRFPSEYQWNGRISIYTGLPSVLGWSFHQRQQRTFDPLPRIVDQRAANVMAFYDTSNIRDAATILLRYDVSYVILGELERVQTSPVDLVSQPLDELPIVPETDPATAEATEKPGIQKFDEMVGLGLLTPVFQEGNSTIYEVNHSALDDYMMNTQVVEDA